MPCHKPWLIHTRSIYGAPAVYLAKQGCEDRAGHMWKLIAWPVASALLWGSDPELCWEAGKDHAHLLWKGW